MTTTPETLLLAARTRGEEDVRTAATWAADGNTSADHIRRVLAMLDAGDPAAYDYLPPVPNLSGEWADDLTPARLLDELGFEDATPDEMDELASAYEDGVAETFAAACEAELRRWVA